MEKQYVPIPACGIAWVNSPVSITPSYGGGFSFTVYNEYTRLEQISFHVNALSIRWINDLSVVVKQKLRITLEQFLSQDRKPSPLSANGIKEMASPSEIANIEYALENFFDV